MTTFTVNESKFGESGIDQQLESLSLIASKAALLIFPFARGGFSSAWAVGVKTHIAEIATTYQMQVRMLHPPMLIYRRWNR
ncbi:hypothetical protein ACFWXH_16965 [Mesorhizobium sp. NPDC059054]|uniref:hypothetical protein n=1 Tax=Mesorhizobium sp. NPDC059054 TaxID=3346711 RepID=UPI0036807503